jgi:hypothetical protein
MCRKYESTHVIEWLDLSLWFCGDCAYAAEEKIKTTGQEYRFIWLGLDED